MCGPDGNPVAGKLIDVPFDRERIPRATEKGFKSVRAGVWEVYLGQKDRIGRLKVFVGRFLIARGGQETQLERLASRRPCSPFYSFSRPRGRTGAADGELHGFPIIGCLRRRRRGA